MEGRLQEVKPPASRPHVVAALLAAMVAAMVAARAAGAGAPAMAAAGIPAATVEPGDVVLRRGNGIWSGFFAGLNRRDARFSHVGIVVRDGGELKVVHAEAADTGADGKVRLTGVDAWTEAGRQFMVLRLADPAAAARVAAAALSMHAAALPFDFDFDLSDAAAVYCSELAWRALAAGLGHDPLPDKPLLGDRPVVLIENFLLDVPELRAIAP
jgi:hypothetical protein